ncbi:hypothetical protein CQW23_29908 [Capsicum baccatum]|uniref:Sialate O-acetylesterase domain-containing protein n=1 Tax=Capsicum baccatum TaxID=33114 RepID=A0A2G2VBS0_CAPBA|nr:hypothetical protein CQW23_29908 [Capsicum baccatum]
MLVNESKTSEECNTTSSNGKKNVQIFLLAGQSNMSGRGGIKIKVVGGNVTEIWNGFVPEECKPNRKIIRFNAALKWEDAHEPLNYGIDCLVSCGLGPGMAFATEILKKDPNFGVIGLVPCSRGGTVLSWNIGFAAICSAVLLSKYTVTGVVTLTPNSPNRPSNQVTSDIVAARLLYFTSAKLLDTVCCFFYHEIKDSPNFIT